MPHPCICIHALPVPVSIWTVRFFSSELHCYWGAFNAIQLWNGCGRADWDSKQSGFELHKRLSWGESISMPRWTSLLSSFGILPNGVTASLFLPHFAFNRFILQSRLMKESTFIAIFYTIILYCASLLVSINVLKIDTLMETVRESNFFFFVHQNWVFMARKCALAAPCDIPTNQWWLLVLNNRHRISSCRRQERCK